MRIGCHIKAVDGRTLDQMICNAIELGANAMQIFLSPPTSSSSGRVIKNEKELQEIIKNTGIYVVVHGKYIINFCRLDMKWQHDAMVNDLRKAHQLGNNIGVVLHQGKNVNKLPREEALQNYVKGIEAVLEDTKDIENPIYLENSCQQGNELGYTIDELATIWSMFDKKWKKRLGFCLDTCHAFVSGSFKINDDANVDEFFGHFDKMIGLEHLKLIHFNDSSVEFDGHNDAHADLTRGHITKDGDTGMRRIVKWAKKYDIPLILETPGEDPTCGEQIEIVNAWAEEGEDLVKAKRTLPEKPKITLKLKSKAPRMTNVKIKVKNTSRSRSREKSD